jgi:hypothetical protein
MFKAVAHSQEQAFTRLGRGGRCAWCELGMERAEKLLMKNTASIHHNRLASHEIAVG